MLTQNVRENAQRQEGFRANRRPQGGVLTRKRPPEILSPFDAAAAIVPEVPQDGGNGQARFRLLEVGQTEVKRGTHVVILGLQPSQ